MNQVECLTIPNSAGPKKYSYKEYRDSYYQRNKEAINARRNARFHEDKAARPAFYMWLGARDRAKRSGRDFNIDVDDIVIPALCPILGFPLQVNKGKLCFNSPVLDRRDNDKGYIKGNVQVISSQANLLKGNCTLDQIILMGQWAQKTKEEEQLDLPFPNSEPLGD